MHPHIVVGLARRVLSESGIKEHEEEITSATTIDKNGEAVQVLFDVMTHTLDGSGGVGDHGKTGIKTFLEKHDCGNRCNRLGLSRDGFESGSEPHPDESDHDQLE
ncbi:hypothetical protein B0H11DRAFT_1912874 [Mycena galericulata]|nr:hypothetical protein B0H11DRAFT_1912874 [Mycena galericulata]